MFFIKRGWEETMLKNKVIMITGASGGMGQVLCEELAAQGAKLVLASRKEETLKAQCDLLKRKYSVEVMGCALDVTKEDQVKEFVERAGETYGKIDALVNLAGLSIPGKIAETDEAVYDLMMDVNVKGVYLMAKYFTQYTAADARMINMGSMAARRTNANAPVYCMAKSALNVLSQGLSLQLAEKGIHVTTLNPGGADTPFWGDRPVKREKLLQAQDIVDVILFVLNSNPRIVIHSVDFESIQMIG